VGLKVVHQLLRLKPCGAAVDCAPTPFQQQQLIKRLQAVLCCFSIVQTSI